jgi:hypothetical protein
LLSGSEESKKNLLTTCSEGGHFAIDQDPL